MKNEDKMPLEQALQDDDRVHYYKGVTEALLNAVNEDGVDVRAYFAWSEYIPVFHRVRVFESDRVLMHDVFPVTQVYLTTSNGAWAQ